MSTTAPKRTRAPRQSRETVAQRRVMLRKLGKPVRDTRELRALAQHLRQVDLSFETGHANAKKAVGNNIRDRRMELLLTQVQVASACGMLQASLGQVERGINGPRFDKFLRIAHALNTTPAKLLDGVKL